MNITYKRCCFAGHSDIPYDGDIREKIKAIAENLITAHNVSCFWVGNYGAFDRCCSSVIKELKKVYKDIKLELVIPYLTNGINEYKELYYNDYDTILMPDIPISTPKRFQIIKGNEYVVDNCDFLICYIERHYGGAYRTFSYARRKKIKIFNISPISIK